MGTLCQRAGKSSEADVRKPYSVPSGVWDDPAECWFGRFILAPRRLVTHCKPSDRSLTSHQSSLNERWRFFTMTEAR